MSTEFEQKKQRHASGESTKSFESVSNYIPTPPDGGYGWIIVLASFINHVIIDGICFTYGVFYVEFLHYFNAGPSKTALVGSLLVGCYLMTGPIAGALTNKYGCRLVCMAGGLLASVSFFLASFAQSLNMLLLTYGVLGGIGMGLAYLPSVVSVSIYFERRRALATGLAVCGAGVGCFIYAPMGRLLLSVYDWRNALIILSAQLLQICVCGALLRPLQAPVHRKRFRQKNVLDRLREKVHHETPTDLDNEAIKQKVQFMKLNREKIIREELGEVTPCNSAINSLYNLDVGSAPPKCYLPDNLVKHVDEPLTEKGKTSDLSPLSPDAPAPRPRPILKPVVLQSAPVLCVNPVAHRQIALSSGVRKDDYSRPLYRKDIFYSGSIVHIPEFHSSQGGTASYTASMTVVPPKTQDSKMFSKLFRDILMEMTNWGILKEPCFAVACVANGLGMLGVYVPFVFIVDRAEALGVSADDAAFLLSIIGITNTLGRVLAGLLANFPRVNSLILHNLAVVLAGLTCAANALCHTYTAMCIAAAAFGLFFAFWISLTSIILCQLIGIERLTNAFGLLCEVRGICSILGPPLAGMIYVFTGNYSAAFLVGGGILLCSGAVFFTLHLPYLQPNRVTVQTDV